VPSVSMVISFAIYGRNSDHKTPNWLPGSRRAHKISAVTPLSTSWQLSDPVTEVTAATDQLLASQWNVYSDINHHYFRY